MICNDGAPTEGRPYKFGNIRDLLKLLVQSFAKAISALESTERKQPNDADQFLPVSGSCAVYSFPELRSSIKKQSCQ